MLEARSPLTSPETIAKNGITLTEAPDFALTQVAGDDKALKKALGKLPKDVGKALEHEGRMLLRVGPKQIWVLGDAVNAEAGVYVTLLSSGRTRFLLEGPRARDVLSASALIDFQLSQLKPAQFVMTGIHHTPVLIHCVSAESFHIYALRTFAQNVWEWLGDIAEGLRND
jgi:methylglutamate dehydrogenase subunit D